MKGMNEKQICSSVGKVGRKSKVNQKGRGLQGKRKEGREAEEIWKEVVGWEKDYQVSTLGNVRSKSRIVQMLSGRPIRRTGKTMALVVRRDGYVQVNFRNLGKLYCPKVHELVASAFIGSRPKGMDIDHRNGKRSDNRSGNLRYLTVSCNVVGKRSRNYKSGLASGVRFDGRNYIASIGKNYKTIYVGTFKNKEDAIAARVSKEKELYGESSHERYTQGIHTIERADA